MMQARRHAGWIIMLVLCWLAGLATRPYTAARLTTARQELVAQQQQTARLQTDYRALAADLALEEKLPAALRASACTQLRAPPPRAQLIAALRQLGLEAGLLDFDLTLGVAAAAQAPDIDQFARPLTASIMTIKAQASSDRPIIAFTQRAVRELPGYIRLEKIALRRRENGAAAASVIIEADIALRWLAFADEPEIARAQR